MLPYFQREGAYDCDNAAIWAGRICKHCGQYYLYYEVFHAIDDVYALFQNDDALQAESVSGYATAN